MEPIWCPPCSFIMGPQGDNEPKTSCYLTKGFYLGNMKLHRSSTKNHGSNPSEFKGENCP